MRTETRTISVGENMGPIDWAYDFRSHFDNYCTSDEGRDMRCEQSKAKLRTIVERFTAGLPIKATTYGGWPRCGWGEVLDVGMYDGWPYWKPVPSVYINGPLGGEWSSFSMVTDIDPEPDSADRGAERAKMDAAIRVDLPKRKEN